MTRREPPEQHTTTRITYSFGSGHYLVAAATDHGWQIGEITAWHGSETLHDQLTPTEAAVLVAAYAATRTHTPES